MFWIVLQPLAISIVFLSFIVAIVAMISSSKGNDWKKIVRYGVLVSTIAIIPTCMLTQPVVDKYRFGIFEYASVEEVNDGMVHLPQESQKIVINKQPGGFHAKYRIHKNELESWLENIWEIRGESSMITKKEAGNPKKASKAEFEQIFSQLNWSAPNDLLRYYGPSSNSVFVVFYSEEQDAAYQFYGYW